MDEAEPSVERIHILGFPAVEQHDLVGPYECLNVWHQEAGGTPCQVVAVEPGSFRGAHGLRISPHMALADAPVPDLFIVPGGDGSRTASQSDVVLQRIRACLDAGGFVASVCTGVRIVHAARVLTGRTVSTHRLAHDEVRSWKDVQLSHKRVTRDGPIWTAAGVASGLDLALALIEALDGQDARAAVARYVEYPPQSL